MKREVRRLNGGGLGRVVVVGLAMVACLVFTGCFRLGADTRELRDVVIAAVDPADSWDKQVEISVGAMTFGVARVIVGFSDLPQEAKAGLRAVRRAEVGVYARHVGGGGGDPTVGGASAVAAAAAAMEHQGWERAITVVDGNETVVIFVPVNAETEDAFHICLVVINDTELVIAKARLATEPLGQLVAIALQETGATARRAPG